jgi:hypothetical protein
MSFRRKTNSHEWWREVVRENAALLRDVPATAVSNKPAFCDYVTRSEHKGLKLSPSVFELSSQALDDLWTFINYKAQFDMDAICFDHFNEAFRARHSQSK